ncbi:MAG: hypothetical protein ACTSQY_05255 [Candidatus Odinarchaeia archaeon]
MSDISKKDQEQLAALGSVLIEKLSKEELRILSLAYDCGEFDRIMDKELNPRVVDDFPGEFYDDFHPECIDKIWVEKAMDEMIAIAPTGDEFEGTNDEITRAVQNEMADELFDSECEDI